MSDERDYASHRPVLRAILAQDKPRTVLEFGAGIHSTPLFLERPEVTRLVSIEPDAGWRGVVRKKCDDPRLSLRHSLDVDPASFDLVFIDNGRSVAERVQTIETVLRPGHPVTVIHDMDERDYLTAVEKLAANFRVVATDPPTAVAW